MRTANASLLFPHGAAGMAQLAYDVVIMTTNASDDSSNASPPAKLKYQAVLTYTGSFAKDMRKGSLAARSQPSDNVIAALESLLLVTALALEKFQGNILKDAAIPAEIAGGTIDEALVFGKSWKPNWAGGKK